MTVLAAWFGWRWLHVRLHWWSFLTLWATRRCRRMAMGGQAPGKWYQRASRWNAKRSAVVDLLTKRGRWQGGSPHPVQARLEPDVKRNPEWWRGERGRRAARMVRR